MMQISTAIIFIEVGVGVIYEVFFWVEGEKNTSLRFLRYYWVCVGHIFLKKLEFKI